jgi:hypothetical protein
MKYNNDELLINGFIFKNENKVKRENLTITDDYPFSISVIKNLLNYKTMLNKLGVSI